MKENTEEINNKGITLVALVITIVVMSILITITISAGEDIYDSAKLEQFTAELKIMQTEVNELYEKYKNEEKININGQEKYINDIGENIVKANPYFLELSDSEKAKYKKYTLDIIKTLEIEGISEEFYVDIENRKVIAVKGFEDGENVYYVLEQIPGAGYNVEYEGRDTSNKPTIVVENKKDGIVISDIQYTGNIGKWYVQYKDTNESEFRECLVDEFLITDDGIYEIKVGNGDVWSEITKITRN